MLVKTRISVLLAGALAALPTAARADHYVLNGTVVVLSVYDNGQLVCTLSPEQSCYFPSPPGSHLIRLERSDGRSIETTVSPANDEDYDQLLMSTICPSDFGVQEQGVPACG